MGKSVQGTAAKPKDAQSPPAKQEEKKANPAKIQQDAESPKVEKKEGKSPGTEQKDVKDSAAGNEPASQDTSSSPAGPPREKDLTESQRGAFTPPNDEQKAGIPTQYQPKKTETRPQNTTLPTTGKPKNVAPPKAEQKEGKGPEAEQKDVKNSTAGNEPEAKGTPFSPAGPSHKKDLTENRRGPFAPPDDDPKADVPTQHQPKKTETRLQNATLPERVNNPLDVRSPALPVQTDGNTVRPAVPGTVDGVFENKTSTGTQVLAEEAGQIDVTAQPGRVLNQSELTPADSNSPEVRFTKILSDVAKEFGTVTQPQGADADPLAMPDWLPEENRPAVDTPREAIVVDGKTVGVLLPDADIGDVNGWVTVGDTSYVSYTDEFDHGEAVSFITQDSLPTPAATGGSDEENAIGTLGILIAAAAERAKGTAGNPSKVGFEFSAGNITDAENNGYVAVGTHFNTATSVPSFERGAEIVNGNQKDLIHIHTYNANPAVAEPSQQDLSTAANVFPNIEQFVAGEKADGSLNILNFTRGRYRDQFAVQKDATISRPEDGSFTLFGFSRQTGPYIGQSTDTVKITPKDLSIPPSERIAEDFKLEFARNGDPVFIPSDIPQGRLFQFATRGQFDISEEGNISASVGGSRFNWTIDADTSSGTAVIRDSGGSPSLNNYYSLEFDPETGKPVAATLVPPKLVPPQPVAKKDDNPVETFTQILSDIGKEFGTTAQPQGTDTDSPAMPDWLPENSRPPVDTPRESIVVDGKNIGVFLPEAKPGDVNGWVTIDGADYVSYTAEDDGPEAVRFITQGSLPTPEATGGTDEENSAGTLGILVAAITDQTVGINKLLPRKGAQASAANLTDVDGNNYIAIGSHLATGSTVASFARGATIVGAEQKELMYSRPFSNNPVFVEPTYSQLETARNNPDNTQFVAGEKEDGSINILNISGGLYRDQFTVRNDANVSRPDDGSFTLSGFGPNSNLNIERSTDTVKITPKDLDIPVFERTADDFRIEFARNGESVFIPSDIPQDKLFQFATEGEFEISKEGNINAQLNFEILKWTIDAQNSSGSLVINDYNGNVSLSNDYSLEFDPETGKPVAATLAPPENVHIDDILSTKQQDEFEQTHIGDLVFTTVQDESEGTVQYISDKNGKLLPRTPELVQEEIINFLPKVDNAKLIYDGPKSFQIRLDSSVTNDELIWDLKGPDGNFAFFDSADILSRFKQYEDSSPETFGELTLNGLDFTASYGQDRFSSVVEILKPEQSFGYPVLGADSQTDLTLISAVARGALLNEADDYQWTYNDKTNTLILTIVNGENTDWKAYIFNPDSNSFFFEQTPEARTEKDEQVVGSNAELEALLFG